MIKFIRSETNRTVTVLGLAFAVIMLGARQACADQTSSWTSNTNGNWSDGANWNPATAPTGTTGVAYFTNTITASRIVTVDSSPWTINSMVFSNRGAYGFTVSNGTLNLAGTAPTITVNASSTGAVASILSGSAGMTKAGSGKLILSGANTFSGATTNLAGTLQIGDGTTATATAGTGALTNAGTLTLNLNAAATLGNSTVYSSGTIQNTGTGKVTITNDPAFAGTVNGGTAGIVLATTLTTAPGLSGDVTLSFSGNMSVLTWNSPATLHISANSTCWQIGGGNIPGAMTLDIASGVTLSQNIAQNGMHYYNNLMGAGNFNAIGWIDPTAYMSYVLGNSTLGGTLTVGGGGLSFGNGGATGTAGATRIVTSASTANVTFNSITNNTYSGIMSGTGGLIKLATNTLTITGANTYSGGTTINAGALQLGDGGALGSGAVSNAAVLAVTNSGALTLGNSITGVGSLTKSGAGTVTLSGINTYSGPTTVNGGALMGGTGGGCLNSAVSVADGATNGVQVLVYGAQWTCAGLTYTGGVPCLTFDMTTVRVSASIPPLQVAGDLNVTGTVSVVVTNGYWPAVGTYPLAAYTGTLNGPGAFNLVGLPAGVSATLNNNTGAKRLELVVTAVPTVSQPVSTWTNLVSGNASGAWGTDANWSGGVPNAADTVADFSTLNITANSYVNNDTPHTVGALRFADTTASHNWYLTNSALTLATSLGQPTITVTNNTAEIDCAVTGTQGFYKDGAGTLTLAGGTNNTLSGGITVNAGILSIFKGYSFQNVTGSITVASGACLSINGQWNYVGGANAFTLSGSGIGTSGALDFGGNQGISGPITLLADSRITFAGNCGVSGTITAGNKNLELYMNGSQYKTDFSGGINLGTGVLKLNSVSGGDIINGYAIGLNAANTYSGGTVLTNYATVRLGNAGALGSGVVTLYPNTRLELNTYSPTIGGLSGTGGSLTDRGAAGTTTVTVAQSGNTTFAGVISNGVTRVLALTKSGLGALTLSGTNTYSGATTISTGELVGVTGGSCSNSAVTVASGATNGVQVAAAGGQWTCTNLTSQAGSVMDFNFNSQAPSATAAPLNVLNNLAFTNATVIVRNVSGTLTDGQKYPLIKYAGTFSGTVTNSALVLSSVTLPAGAQAYLLNNTGSKSIDLLVTTSTNLTWAVGSGNWDILTTTNWAHGGVGGFYYSDNSAVTFDDTASVSAGPFLVTNTVVVSPASVTVSNVTKAYTVSGSAIAGSATLTKQGAGTLILATNNTYSGTTTISAGTLAIGNGSNTTASAGTGVLTNGNSTLLFNFNGPVTLANSSVAAGGAAPSIQNIGAGKVTYTNNATATPYSLRGGNAGIVLVNQITGGGPNVYGDITLSVNNVNAGLSSWGSGCTLHFVGVNTAWAIGGAGGTPWATAPTLDIATSVTLAQNGSGGDKYYNNLTGAGNFTFQGQSSQYGYIVGTSTLGGTLQVGNGSGKYCSGFSFGNGGSGGLAGSTRIVAYTNVTFNSTTDNTYSGIMSGVGGLIKLAANTLTLTGVNTYSGATTVSNGTLSITGSGTLDSGTTVNLAGGTLDLSNSFTVAALQFNGAGKATGTWGSATSGATHTNSQFTGSGILTVTSGGGTSSSALSSSANPSTYGDGVTITNTVTGSGGIPTGAVTFSTNSVPLATVALAGGKAILTLPSTLAVGTYNITATYSGDDNFNGSTAGELSQGVDKKGLTVTANAQSKAYGTALDLGTSEFTPVGLVNGEGIGAVTLTSDGAAELAAVGSYDITPSAATGGTCNTNNYAITYVPGTLTVSPNPAALGIWNGHDSGILGGNDTNFNGQTFAAASAATSTLRFMDTDGLGNAVTRLALTTVAGGVGLDGTLLFTNSAVNYTVAGADANGIAGLSALTKAGSGTLTLNGANTYSGATTVNGGTLVAAVANALGGSTTITVANGATLQIGNASALASAAVVSLGSTATNSLDYSGSQDVNSLYIGGVQQCRGRWGSVGNGSALWTGPQFTGGGILNVLNGPDAGSVYKIR